MPNLTDLEQRLQDLEVRDSRHDLLQESELDYHELRLEYPVLDLLPTEETVIPHLRRPKYGDFCKKPDLSEYHWDVSGTDFAIRMPLRPFSSICFSPLQFSTVLSAMARLRDRPGRSLLQFVSCHSSTSGVQHCFRLLTENNEQHQTITQGWFSDDDWRLESAGFQSETWMQLIRNLMNRASDRAYFHVHQRMHLYSWYTTLLEQEHWNSGDRTCLDIYDTLVSKLRVQLSDDLYVRAIEAFDSGYDGTFVLPCGHDQYFPIQGLESMSVTDCTNAACHLCGEKIIAQRDLRRFCEYRESERRHHFYERETWWRNKQESCPMGPGRVSVRTGLLFRALDDALSSLMVPKFVSPMILDMASSQLASSVLEALPGYVNQDSSTVATCSSVDLVASVMANLDAVLGQVLGNSPVLRFVLPGWTVMSRLWASRAVLLVTDPDYEKYDLSAIMGKVTEADQSPQDRAAMDELEALLGSASLD